MSRFLDEEDIELYDSQDELKVDSEVEDDFEMDVQAGPEEELNAEPGMNPVEIAKQDADTVAVAQTNITKEGECCKEFYVDANDIEKHARLNEQTFVDSLNDVIYANREAGMTARNTTIVAHESNNTLRSLYNHGASIKLLYESDESALDDIEMDVQVGPNGDEMKVEEDPQEANPVDAVKRNYDSVVVAKDGDNFFVDVEDVQKCAELNCESVVRTLNNVIRVNESTGISADNICVIINNNTTNNTIRTLSRSDVHMAHQYEFI